MEYRGIMAGIGDPLTGINTIMPFFDAEIYDFIIGDNGIVHGLDYNNSTGIITAGMCIVNGYRGYLTENKSIGTNKDVYAKYELHNNPQIEDTFNIEVLASGTNVRSTYNETTKQGTIYYKLYPGANKILKPKNAVHSIYTEEATERLANGVTAITQNVNDNSNKVATTEYVHNQIKEEVDFGELTVYPYNTSVTTEVGTLLLKRKAKIVSAILNITNIDAAVKGIYFGIPTGYKPKNTVIFPFFLRTENSGRMTYLGAIYQINTDGSVAIVGTSYSGTAETLRARDMPNITTLNLGWEIA